MNGACQLFACAATLALVATLWPASFAEAHEGAATPPRGELTAVPLANFKDACAAVDAFHAALAKGDANAALAFLAEDVHIFEQGEVERSKAEYASKHLPSDIEFSRGTQSAQTARTGSALGDFAYVASEGQISGRYKDRDVNVISIETMVLRRTPHGWRIAHVHWSSRKATTP